MVRLPRSRLSPGATTACPSANAQQLGMRAWDIPACGKSWKFPISAAGGLAAPCQKDPKLAACARQARRGGGEPWRAMGKEPSRLLMPCDTGTSIGSNGKPRPAHRKTIPTHAMCTRPTSPRSRSTNSWALFASPASSTQLPPAVSLTPRTARSQIMGGVV
jgi:hypothetical protein